MASQEAQALLKLGPFVGLDLTKAGPSVEPGHAIDALNANPTIIDDALTPERGRINMTSFAGTLASVSIVYPVMQSSLFAAGKNGSSIPLYLVGGLTAGGTFAAYLYNPATNTSQAVTYGGSAPAAMQPFDMAVQSGGVVYLNNGYRLFLNQAANSGYAVAFYAWQYPAPVAFGNVTAVCTAYAPGLVNAAGTSPIHTIGVPTTITPTNMTNITNGNRVVIDSGAQQEILTVSGATGSTFQVTPLLMHDTGFIIQAGVPGTGAGAETVSYLFTRITTMPDGTTSETSVDLNQFASPPSSTSSSGSGLFTVAPINGYVWSGTSALDGSTFTTNIYRSSNLQPTFFLVANTGTQGLGTTTPFVDVAPDTAIVGNAQLETRDQPPLVPGSYGVPSDQFNFGSICIHKGRTWVYAIVQNTSTLNVPEVQLWYSNLGRPWEFDQVNQVMLLQSDVVNSYGNSFVLDGSATYDNPYGNDPLGMAEVGTFLMAHSRRQTWAIYGDSPTNFLARQNFNIGCVSRHSITPTTGGEFWLSENGAYWFDGSTPQFIDEGIRGLLQSNPDSPAVAQSDQRQSTGFFSNMTWYLAFPTLGYTLGYDTPSGKWLSRLPYSPSGPAAVSFTPAYPSQYSATGTVGSLNEVVAARNGLSTSVDWLFADANFDLNNAQTFSWTGPLTWCGDDKDSWEKIFSHVTLTAPIQFGTAVVTLSVDPGFPTGNSRQFTFDLSKAARQISTVGDGQGGGLRGFLCQLSVIVTGAAGQNAPQIWKVSAFGTMSRNLAIPV